MKIFNKGSITASFIASFVIALAAPLAVSAASPATINLLSAANFVILAKTAITTTGVTAITGDIGISPAFDANMTGFGFALDGSGTFSTSALLTGRAYAADYSIPTPATLTAAVSAMEAAYTDGNSRAVDVTDAGAGDLAGLTLVTGVYFFSGPGNVIITDDVTLSGSASDVWIFQIAGTLDISATKKILLTGGAQASNVFWVVAGTTTLEPGSTFEGNILAGPGASTIAGQSGAILHGRALGQTDVTLIANTVSVPVPAVVVTPSSSSSGTGETSHSTGSFTGYSGGVGIYAPVSKTLAVASPIVPSLPNAGFPPRTNNTLFGLAMLSGLLVLISSATILVLKKNKV